MYCKVHISEIIPNDNKSGIVMFTFVLFNIKEERKIIE